MDLVCWACRSLSCVMRFFFCDVSGALMGDAETFFFLQGADSIRLMCENPKAALAEDAAILAKLFLIVEAFEQLSSLC